MKYLVFMNDYLVPIRIWLKGFDKDNSFVIPSEPYTINRVKNEDTIISIPHCVCISILFPTSGNLKPKKKK